MSTRFVPSSAIPATRPGDAVLAHLQVIRRRARQVLAARYCMIAAGPALVVGYAASVATAATIPQTVGIVLASLLAGGTVAAAVAWRRTPTLATTAAIVDRRQRLESCATTGLQFAADDDPVATLVTRDAAARLHGCEPAAVFPLELPNRWQWMLSGVATVLLLFAVTARDVGLNIERDSSRGGTAAGSAQARPADGSSRGASTSQASPPATDRPAPKVAGARGPEASTGVPAGDRAPSAVPSSSAGNPVASSAATPAAPSSASGEPAPVRSSAPSAGSSISSGGAAGSGGSAPSAHDVAKQAATGAGGAGGASASGQASGAGGVRGGALARPGSAVTLAEHAASRLTAASYRREWERGQAAIAAERVPPALRKYVRDYFAAIRPRQP